MATLAPSDAPAMPIADAMTRSASRDEKRPRGLHVQDEPCQIRVAAGDGWRDRRGTAVPAKIDRERMEARVRKPVGDRVPVRARSRQHVEEDDGGRRTAARLIKRSGNRHAVVGSHADGARAGRLRHHRCQDDDGRRRHGAGSVAPRRRPTVREAHTCSSPPCTQGPPGTRERPVRGRQTARARRSRGRSTLHPGGEARGTA